MMNSSGEGTQTLDHRDDELDDWINELICEDYRDFLVDNTGAAAMTIVPNFPTQPNTTNTVNGGTILIGGSSANKPQSGISEIMTVNNLAANASSAAPPTSGPILSAAAPNFVANPVAQSTSRPSRTTTDLPPQYQPVVQTSQPLQTQPLSQSQVLKQNAIQQPQANSSISFGHHQNRMPSGQQLQPYPRTMVNGQTGHMRYGWQQSNTTQPQQPLVQPRPVVQPIQNFQQNPNQMNVQFQQPLSSPSNLMSGDGRNRLQGITINDGQRKPQEQQQGLIATVMAGAGVFKAPNEFPNGDAWLEYAFSQIVQMKERYLTDLLLMQRNARNLCFEQMQSDPESAAKYETVKKFLEKMIAFLSIPTADMLPKSYERVYGYMNFVLNYLHSFRNKNGSVSSQLLMNQPPPPQMIQPAANMRLQFSPQQQNLAQGITNLETNMMNFNQNFPSRRPQQLRIPTSPSVGFQTAGMDQRPANSLVNGMLHGAQLNGLSPPMQKSTSGGGLLTTTTATNFQSHHQLNNQPRLNSEKLKQPMSPLGGASSRTTVINQFPSPPFFVTSSSAGTTNKPMNQPIIVGAPVWSSWNGVGANNVLSPQSIARSPFLVTGSSSSPPIIIQHAEQKLQLSPLGVSSSSTDEGKNPETPMSVQSGDLAAVVRGKAPVTGAAPRTPTSSSAGTEKGQETSQDLSDPQLRLIRAVKSLSSKAMSSSFNDICSAKKAMDSIPYGPPNPMAPYKQMEPNFLLKLDNEQMNFIAPYIEDEPAFLVEYENERGQRRRRKVSITSKDGSSSPDFRDLDSFDEFVCEEWDMDSTGTSMKKKPKIERINVTILEEMKEINSKLLETSLEVSEDNMSSHGGYEGTILKCLYRNVSSPELLTLMGGSSSQKGPEFVIELLVPVNYPASSPIVVSNSCCNVPGNEVCGMLYKEMVFRFGRLVRELGEKTSIGEMAHHWDACARGVVMELAQQRGAGSFVSSYGKWESCS